MQGLTPKIYRHESVNSTNAKLKEFIRKGASSGTVVVAESQTEGRGRMGRTWHSPSGGLYFSVYFVPKNAKRLTDFSLLAGVAVAQTIKSLLPKAKEISVKWPNDCLVDWKKIAGVLCETVGDTPHAVIIGIGVNINTTKRELEPFLKNPFSATSVALEEAGENHSIESLFDTMLTKLFELYRIYEEQGFATIKRLWELNCLMIGKKIELCEPGHQETDGVRGKVTGTFLGIDDSGALLLLNQKNEKKSYVSGEITCFWP